jgi:hypothetical protein
VKIKLLLFFILGFLISLFLWFLPIFKKKTPHPLPPVKAEGSSFFVPISIAGFSANNIPCLNVRIENKKFLFELDLGLGSDASIASEFLQMIDNKSFVKQITAGGLRGNPYQVNDYKIPNIKIDALDFHPIHLREDHPLLTAECHIGKKKKETIGLIAGRIGWKIFKTTTLFLDLKHSIIIISDSIETFKKHGPPLQTFIKVPMLNDHGAIEVETTSPKGPLRCMVDTGCTFDLLNTNNPKNRPLEKMILKEKKFSSFLIGGQDFGPITFNKIPIKLPFPIDAVLGMEFLSKHAVFIDFVNQEIYFSKAYE